MTSEKPLAELVAENDAEVNALIDKWSREVDDLVEEYAHDTDALLAELELAQIGALSTRTAPNDKQGSKHDDKRKELHDSRSRSPD